jgi:hypothetical protein
MRVVWALLLLSLCSSAMNPLEMRLVDQLKSWQKRLGLDDWNMKLQVVRQNEIDPNSWGSSHWDVRAKTATIQVLDPRDYNLKGADLRLDMECTIVHELVHIQVAPLGTAADVQVREDVVNRIMTALLNRPCPN